MTEEVKKPTTRTRAKPQVATVETSSKTKPTRTRTSRKPVKPPIPEETTTPTPNPPPTSTVVDEEVVELEKPVASPVLTSSDIAAAVTAQQEGDKIGNSNYSIGTTFGSIVKQDVARLGVYPLHVWARNPNSLTTLANIAGGRVLDDRASAADIQIIDFAEQNRSNDDPFFYSFYANEGGNWNNYLEVGERKLRSSRVNYGTKTVGNVLASNGEQLQTVLARRLELGTPLLVRLWHSGIVFLLNPIDKAERIAMVEALNSAHLETLRRTNGIIHGTSSYYANRIVTQTFMKLVRDSNIDRSLWIDAHSLIDHRDIQIMAWALMSSAHQRGYDYVETCGNITTKKNSDGSDVLDKDGNPIKGLCNHTVRSVIDLSLIVQIDDSKFNDWQKSFISKPLSSEKATLEDIKKYQRLGKMHESAYVEIVDGVSVILKAPPISRHIEIGEEWIDAVENAVDEAIQSNVDEVTRNEAIQRQIEATAALDVAHWVDGFIIDGEEIRRNDIESAVASDGDYVEDAVLSTFRMLGNNDEIRDLIYSKIRENVSKNLAAVVAIPTHECAGCHVLSNVVNNNGTTIYTPIDMVSRFFVLTARNQ